MRAYPKCLLLSSALALAACATGDPAREAAVSDPTASDAEAFEEDPGNRRALFGELHLHTRYSFDAYIFNVRATPDDAYRYAKGEQIMHAGGFPLKLSGPPLDFMAVTDHAEYMGIIPALDDPSSPLSSLDFAKGLFSTDPDEILTAFGQVARSLRLGVADPQLLHRPTIESAWQAQIDAAKKHYEPGKFTTFIGYEFTSAPNSMNLHRNVLFGNTVVPELPYSAFDSQDPEGLWRWLDKQRSQGSQVLAIPHNSNASDGRMFGLTEYSVKSITPPYAALRKRNEPLVEITQVKGTSETHPSLSPNDEWSGFEILSTYIASDTLITKFRGGYVRAALGDGMALAEKTGVNPYEFGFIGASDSHNGAGSFDESNYFSKVGLQDSTPERRGSVPPEGKDWSNYSIPGANSRYAQWGASGLAGVWAETNNRAAIFAAMQRRETFATSGPRMKIRMFAVSGAADARLGANPTSADLYRLGKPMGSVVSGAMPGGAVFRIMAAGDPNSVPLQRLQIVKGWLENGKPMEQVFDVSCADGSAPDPKTSRCRYNGAKVDLTNCKAYPGSNTRQLEARWRDPKFKPDQRAYYYARVLEDPTCRWSMWDSLATKRPHNPKLQKTIQERAWSSPIWFE